MAKQSGLGDNFFVGGKDLSGDTASLDEVGGGPALIEVTGIDKSAFERIGGLRDGRIEWTAHFNTGTDGTDGTHNFLATLPTSDRHAMYFRGTTLGGPAAACVGKQLNYDMTRADDGKLTLKVRIDANSYGLEWGTGLTAGIRTDTAATAGGAVDTGASLSFGAQAYLQVFAFTGTTAAIKVQDSADGATFADVAGLSFGAVTAAPAVERIATANTATVRRHVKVTTSGTFTSLKFAVMLNKNEFEGTAF